MLGYHPVSKSQFRQKSGHSTFVLSTIDVKQKQRKNLSHNRTSPAITVASKNQRRPIGLDCSAAAVADIKSKCKIDNKM